MSDQRERPAPAGAPSFAELVRDEAPKLFAALRMISDDRAEAEDLLRRSLQKAWDRWERVRSMDDPTRYLFRTAMDLYGKRRVPVRRPAPTPSDDRIAEAESRDEVLKALSRLSRGQRQSLVLTDLFGYPSKEAGKLMGIPAFRVRTLASQGRRELGRLLGGSDG